MIYHSIWSVVGLFLFLKKYNIFYCCPLSPPPRDLINQNIRLFVRIPQVPEALFFVFCFCFLTQSIFSLFFRLDNFYCCSFKFTVCFLSPSFCYWAHPLSFPFLLLYFLILNFVFGSSLYHLISLLRLSVSLLSLCLFQASS